MKESSKKASRRESAPISASEPKRKNLPSEEATLTYKSLVDLNDGRTKTAKWQPLSKEQVVERVSGLEEALEVLHEIDHGSTRASRARTSIASVALARGLRGIERDMKAIFKNER